MNRIWKLTLILMSTILVLFSSPHKGWPQKQGAARGDHDPMVVYPFYHQLHEEVLCGVEFCGDRIIAWGDNGMFTINRATGQLVERYKVPDVSKVALSSDQKTVACISEAGGSIHISNISSNRINDKGLSFGHGHSHKVTAIKFVGKGDQQVITASEDGEVRVWKASDGALISASRPSDQVLGADVSTNGDVVALLSTNPAVLMKYPSMECIDTIGTYGPACFLGDSSRLLICDFVESRINIYDCKRNVLVARIETGRVSPMGCLYHRRSNSFAIVMVAQPTDKEHTASVVKCYNAAAPELPPICQLAHEAIDYAESLAISDDGKYGAAIGNMGTTMLIWRIGDVLSKNANDLD